MVSSPPYQHITVTHQKDWGSLYADVSVARAAADASRSASQLDRERAATEREKRLARRESEDRKAREKSEKEFIKLQAQLETASNSTEIMHVLHRMKELPSLAEAEDFAFKYIQHTSELRPQEKISLLGAHTGKQSQVIKMLPSLLSALPVEDLQFDALMPVISAHGKEAEEYIHEQLDGLIDLDKKKGKQGPWTVVKRLEPIVKEINASGDLTDTQKIRLSIHALKTLAQTNGSWFKPALKMRYGSFLGLNAEMRRKKFEDVIKNLMSSVAYRPVITVRGISLLA